jgi:uncharacterized protein YkwD
MKQIKMKNIAKILLLLTVVFVASCHKNRDILPDVYNLDVAMMLRLINEQRVAGCQCGGVDMPPVPPLQWNHQLAKAALLHSIDMNTHRTLNHTSSDGRSPGDRIRAAGYNASTWGENIAVGYADEKAVMNGWMKSSGHCANIMNKNFTEVGAGRKERYWTMTLARPR